MDLITLNDDLEEFKNNPSLKTGKKAGKWVVRGGKAIFIAADGQVYKATGKKAAEFISQISKTKIAKKGISSLDNVTKSIVKHTDNLKKKVGEVGDKIVKGWENLISGGNGSKVAKQVGGLGVETKVLKLGVNIDGTVTTGKVIDKALGNSPTSRIGLGETFKTFDTFENGVATSI
ncbi:hypothetical protein EII29_11210, partial [Leptotrichia sp. OH3620_COT-345]|uniref:hypothetical protein n=1 Tax=Leptotrichia sp. OH3620_COT-345 TaxID=2491048 RepID=UPI000FBAB4F4